MKTAHGRSQVVFANGKLFAIREVHDRTPGANVISKDKRTVFLPELGGIAYNFETFGREVTAVRLGKLKVIQGASSTGKVTLKARFRAEVWLTSEGARIHLAETWHAANVATGHKNLASAVKEFIQKEDGAFEKEFQSTELASKLSFYKTERDKKIDVLNNAKEATLRLLEKDNPALAKAIKSGKANETLAKGFVADTVRRAGSSPPGFSTDDPEFNAMFSEALQAYDRRTKRKNKADALDYHLANPKNWSRYFNMKPAAIAPLAAKATGTPIQTPGGIAKRIERLGLVQPWKRGRSKSD